MAATTRRCELLTALRWRCLSEHVGKKSSVARLLVSNELNVRAVLSSEAGIEEVLVGEDGETVVEQVKLNPLLIKTKGNRLEVEVTLDHISWQGTVGTKTTSRGVWSRLFIQQHTLGVVVGGSRVWWQGADGGGSRAAHEGTSGGGSARVRSVASRASDLAGPDRRSWQSGHGAVRDLAVRAKLGG